MVQNTNFPVSNTPFTDENGRLVKEARTLLRSMWQHSAGAPNQLGWVPSATTVEQGPLAPYTGGTTPANMAAQITLLTNLVGTLVNALENYGILEN